MNTKKAFTLAEVLITLTIIGVIAAITIPNLMQKWEESHTVSGVKEAYSILSNAFKMTITENGYLTEWNWPTDSLERRIFLFEKLKPYLKVAKVYGHGGQFQKETKMYFCGGNGAMYAKNLTGKTGNSLHCYTDGNYIFSLTNGMTISFDFVLLSDAINSPNSAKYSSTSPCGDCRLGDITVDINGFRRGPNRWGYDIFAFEFYFDGLQLYRDYSWGSTSSSVLCTQTGAWKDSNTNGKSCSFWIITKGNTEYQKQDVGNFKGAGWQGWK